MSENASNEMQELVVPATIDQLQTVIDFFHVGLEERDCPIAEQMRFDIALEELFVNVCNYAYRDLGEPGKCKLSVSYTPDARSITAIIDDTGVAFDPLAHTDPARPTSVETTPIGGLGILMAKRNVDSISYSRDDGHNVITLVKSW